MIRLTAFAAFAFAITTSAYAMTVAPVHQPESMITQAAYGELTASAWRGPPFVRHAAIIVGVHDGMGRLRALLLTP